MNTTKTAFPKLKNHAPYAGLLLGGIGFLANVAGIAGLVLEHGNELVIFASLLATICGLYLLLRRWGKTVDIRVLAAVVLIVAGSVVLTLALKNRSIHEGQHPQDNSQTTTDGSGDTADAGDSTPISVPDVSGNHTVVFRKSLKLLSQQGLDIDDKKASVLEQQSTASSPSDIYLSNYPALFVTVDNFYTYQRPSSSTGNTDKDQYNVCQSLIAHSQLGEHILVDTSIKPGQQYCLTTTAGKLALVTVQELASGGKDPSQYNASIAVKVWD